MNKNLILFICLGLAACKGKVVQDVQTTFVKRGMFLKLPGFIHVIKQFTISLLSQNDLEGR